MWLWIWRLQFKLLKGLKITLLRHHQFISKTRVYTLTAQFTRRPGSEKQINSLGWHYHSSAWQSWSVNVYFILSPQDHSTGEVTQLFCCTHNHDDSNELPENMPSTFPLHYRYTVPFRYKSLWYANLSFHASVWIMHSQRSSGRHEMNACDQHFFFCTMHKDLQKQLHNLHVMLFNIVPEVMWMKSGI